MKKLRTSNKNYKPFPNEHKYTFGNILPNTLIEDPFKRELEYWRDIFHDSTIRPISQSLTDKQKLAKANIARLLHEFDMRDKESKIRQQEKELQLSDDHDRSPDDQSLLPKPIKSKENWKLSLPLLFIITIFICLIYGSFMIQYSIHQIHDLLIKMSYFYHL